MLNPSRAQQGKAISKCKLHNTPYPLKGDMNLTIHVRRIKNMIKINTDSKLAFFQKILAIVSALSPQEKQLSPNELDTLSRFLTLPRKYEYFPFTSRARKEIYTQYDPPMTVQILSSRVASLISKGYLVRDEDNFVDFAPQIKKLRALNTFDVKIQDNTPNRTDS
jgi:hypothetical protein